LKEAALKNNWSVLCEAIVPDEIAQIQETIRSFAAQGCGLILTTGGTGLAARDITPEAIRGLMRVELPGFGEVMRAESMKITPNAILSRNLGAVVEQSLVVALPGKPSGAVECLGFVTGAIPHGVALAHTSCDQASRCGRSPTISWAATRPRRTSRTRSSISGGSTGGASGRATPTCCWPARH